MVLRLTYVPSFLLITVPDTALFTSRFKDLLQKKGKEIYFILYIFYDGKCKSVAYALRVIIRLCKVSLIIFEKTGQTGLTKMIPILSWFGMLVISMTSIQYVRRDVARVMTKLVHYHKNTLVSFLYKFLLQKTKLR